MVELACRLVDGDAQLSVPPEAVRLGGVVFEVTVYWAVMVQPVAVLVTVTVTTPALEVLAEEVVEPVDQL